MKVFSWLHLTDLHFGSSPQQWLWPNVREEFYSDLRRMLPQIGPIDLVIFSGDLTQKGTNEQFKGLTSLLEELWYLFAERSMSPFLLSVPGNHDLIRADSKSGVVVALRKWHEEDIVRETFWSDAESDYRRAVIASFEPYAEWFKKLTSTSIPIPSCIPGIVPGDFSSVIPAAGLKVGLIGLNSAFLQLTEGSYDNQLVIDPRQFNAVTQGDPPKWCHQNDFNLLITHHPPDLFHSASRDLYRSEIYIPNRFVAHLCGHLHEHDQSTISEGGASPRRTIQTTSMFGLKQWGESATDRRHGYSLFRLTIDNGTAALKTWPRKVILTKSGQLRMVADQEWDLQSDESFDLVVTESILSLHGNIKGTVAIDQSIDEADRKADSAAKNDIQDRSASLLSQIMKGKVDPTEAKQLLASIPRFRASVSPAHLEVRQYEQQSIKHAFQSNSAVWLIADYGLGKDDFLATVLGTRSANSFRLDCDNGKL